LTLPLLSLIPALPLAAVLVNLLLGDRLGRRGTAWLACGSVDGQVIVFFVMTVAAAEAAVGLAIILTVFRNRATTNADEMTLLRW